jgi:hypothetical protein
MYWSAVTFGCPHFCSSIRGAGRCRRMTWTESDSRLYQELATVAVPDRAEQMAALLTLLAFDGSPKMLTRTTERLRSFADRVEVAHFDLASTEWWPRVRKHASCSRPPEIGLLSGRLRS